MNSVASPLSMPFMVMNFARDALFISVGKGRGAIISEQRFDGRGVAGSSCYRTAVLTLRAGMANTIISRLHATEHSNTLPPQAALLASDRGYALPRACDEHHSDNTLVCPGLQDGQTVATNQGAPAVS